MTLASRCYSFLAFLIAILVGTTLAVLLAAEHRFSSEHTHYAGAVALADAQSALWELRYGFPQYMLGDAAARAKIVDEEPGLRSRIAAQLEVYAALQLSPQERQTLETLAHNYAQYVEARPRWFQLYGENKLDEAKEWRARTTLPLGAATVQGFSTLINMQRQLSDSQRSAAGQFFGNLKLGVLAGIALAIGLCVASMLWLIRSIMQPLQAAIAVSNRITSGELGAEIRVETQDEFGTLLSSLRQMDSKLSEIVNDVRLSADSVGSAAQQLTQGNEDLSTRTQSQATALEHTASSIEEMTTTVKQNADNARQASQIASGARGHAEQGGEVVTRAMAAMDEINSSSRKIADIIGVIDEIAFQTNLLALNAAVEAARAGEQGRGFAVVATEVRSLAQRSATAAKEIKALINDSVDKVKAGAQLVQASGTTLDAIVESVRRVSDIVAEISSASDEQATGIEQVNRAIVQIDQATQQNAAAVQHANQASKAVQVQAQQLMSRINFFRTDSTHGVRQIARVPSAVTAPHSTVSTATDAPQRRTGTYNS